jgi:hypothetical protein
MLPHYLVAMTRRTKWRSQWLPYVYPAYAMGS